MTADRFGPLSPHAARHARLESFRARSLSASLTVKDLQTSVRWYRDIVGFTVDEEHEGDGVVRAISLKAGDVRLLIGQDDGAKGLDRARGEGFSLMITTAQDVDQVARRIEERGGMLEMQPTDTPWGARALRVVDPDGFRITITSEPRRP
jgi:uncharacterized glyoxalase superfamily protein PhnB